MGPDEWWLFPDVSLSKEPGAMGLVALEPVVKGAIEEGMDRVGLVVGSVDTLVERCTLYMSSGTSDTRSGRGEEDWSRVDIGLQGRLELRRDRRTASRIKIHPLRVTIE